MNTNMLKHYASLTVKKRAIQAQLKELQDEIDKLEAQVVTELQEAGAQSLKLDNYTVYLRHDVYPSYPEGKEKAVALLKRSRNYRSLVQETVNHQTLCSLLRELGPSRPANWTGILEVDDVYRVGVRKS